VIDGFDWESMDYDPMTIHPPEYTELTHQLHGVFETAEVEMGWEE
jgi:hypothetical protein